MRLARVFAWSDADRLDDRDEIRSLELPRKVTHAGASFELRTWDIRDPAGEDRVTDAFYDEVVTERTPRSGRRRAVIRSTLNRKLCLSP